MQCNSGRVLGVGPMFLLAALWLERMQINCLEQSTPTNRFMMRPCEACSKSLDSMPRTLNPSLYDNVQSPITHRDATYA